MSKNPSTESQQSNPNAPPSATKKRKARQSSAGGAAATSKGKSKDTAWKPSKDDLSNDDTDDYTSEGAITTDPEDLTKYIENPYGKKVYTVEYEGNGRRVVKRRQRKKVRGGEGENGDAGSDGDDNEDEDSELSDVDLDEDDIEGTATASPATRKRNAPSKRGKAPAGRGKRVSGVSTTATRGTRNTSVDGSIRSNDDTASQAPSQASPPITSFYLHAPSENGAPSEDAAPSTTSQAGGTSTQAGPSNAPLQPEFKSAQQAGLVQTYPKADNFQPYFAYSTTTLGANGRQASRVRRDTTLSTSTEGGSATPAPPTANNSSAHNSYASRLLEHSRGGASSTASFDQRGSDYDYAEEEKMTAALLAAKQRGMNGKGIPEGRAILPDMLLPRNYGSYPSLNKYTQSHPQQKSQLELWKEREREMSLSAASDLTSSDVHPTTSRQQQQQLAASTSRLAPGPRRAPAPPPRASSVLSESTNHPPGQYESFAASSSVIDGDLHEAGEESFAQKQAKKSLGRRLGEIVRAVFIAAYWSVAGPLRWITNQDASTIWKSAGAMLLLGLIIGSMYEQNPSHSNSSRSSVWDRLPFLSTPNRHSQPSYHAPESLPSNFDEVIQRLTSLESSFRDFSSSASQQYTTSTEQVDLLRNSNKRLSELETEFESEKRKASKIRDSNEKQRLADNTNIESTIKGIKNRLDSFNELMKSHEVERKTDSSDLSKLKNELGKVNKDLDAYRGRMDMRVGKMDSALDNERVIKIVREAIEEVLPDRLAVSLDAKTGQVNVDPKFWHYLKEHFSSAQQEGGSSNSASVSWEDFIHSNADKLRKIVHGEIDGQLSKEINEGAILSKKSFSEALERELRALTHKFTTATSEQLAHLSHEVEGKLSKLKHVTSGEAHKSVKISNAKGEDVTSLVNSLIDEALSKYSKDVLARPDFALYTAGGRVIPSLTSPSYEIRPSTLSGSIISKLTGSGVIRGKSPVTALHPDISTGQCWAINGPTGQLGILLSREISPTDVTVEHASKEVALDVSSAPKNFEVWGIVADPSDLERVPASQAEEGEGEIINRQGNMIKLLNSTYDINASNNIQTFDIDESMQELKIPISAVIFKILDNYGNENLSCLYRVRVGGEVAEQVIQ